MTSADHDIANLLRMLLLAATETTTRTFAILMLHLFEHPESDGAAESGSEPDSEGAERSMRLEPVNGHMARVAGKDMLIGGVTIPKAMR